MLLYCMSYVIYILHYMAYIACHKLNNMKFTPYCCILLIVCGTRHTSRNSLWYVWQSSPRTMYKCIALYDVQCTSYSVPRCIWCMWVFMSHNLYELILYDVQYTSYYITYVRIHDIKYNVRRTLYFIQYNYHDECI